MTTGQRIAQKRKELGLSQEALGEKLGVSRQSIYKWESDSALPEIEKLVALSRLFGISVGALLGVEEETAQPSGELTEAQLKMVEEIAARCGKAPLRRRWLLPLGAAVLTALLLTSALVSLTRRLDGMEERYAALQSSIYSVSGTVNSQMDAVTAQVEEMLKARNELTGDYAAQVMSVDAAKNTVTFSFRATPKTFTEGTVAYLEITDASGSAAFGPYEPLEGGTFLGTAETQLTDSIQLSVIFETKGVQFRQVLNTFEGLWSQHRPHVSAEYLGGIMVYRAGMEPNHCFLESAYAYLTEPLPEDAAQVRFGVFLNRRLLGWAEDTPCEAPEDYLGSGMEFTNYSFYRLPDLAISYEWGDELCIAALVTDRNGRQSIQIIQSWELQTDQRGHCDPQEFSPGDAVHFLPEDWILE